MGALERLVDEGGVVQGELGGDVGEAVPGASTLERRK